MQKNRFGSGKRDKSCVCCNCSKNIAVGEERYFDNQTFPRKPICGTCLLKLDNTIAGLDALALAKLASAVLKALEPDIDRLVDKLADKIAAKLREPF